jgi:hypothetical protein
MGNDFENSQNKYSKEDIDFFNELAERYGLEQNADQFIFLKKNGNKVFIPKWYEIPTKSGKIKIEDALEKEINAID